MTEGDAPLEKKNCNEGRFRLWGFLDWHTWRWQDSAYRGPHERVVTERCRVCDAERKRRETAVWA